MIFLLLSLEKGQPGTWELWVRRMLHLGVCGWEGLGWRSWFFWAACQMNSHAGVTVLMWQWAALVWSLLGDMSQRAWLCLGCRSHPAQIHKETVKDLGLAELSTLPTALWNLCGSVRTGECGLWVHKGWPSLRWASETNLLFLQATCQTNLLYKLTSLYLQREVFVLILPIERLFQKVALLMLFVISSQNLFTECFCFCANMVH